MRFNIRIVRNWIVSIIMIVSVGGAMLTIALPQTANAAPATCNENRLLGFPVWYRGLADPNKLLPECELLSPSDPSLFSNQTNKIGLYILTIGLNILEIALLAIVYLSAGYLLYGGFLFIVSQGKPEGAANARKTMLNAVIGLLISMPAVAVVNFVVAEVIK